MKGNHGGVVLCFRAGTPAELTVKPQQERGHLLAITREE